MVPVAARRIPCLVMVCVSRHHLPFTFHCPKRSVSSRAGELARPWFLTQFDHHVGSARIAVWPSIATGSSSAAL